MWELASLSVQVWPDLSVSHTPLQSSSLNLFLYFLSGSLVIHIFTVGFNLSAWKFISLCSMMLYVYIYIISVWTTNNMGTQNDWQTLHIILEISLNMRSPTLALVGVTHVWCDNMCIYNSGFVMLDIYHPPSIQVVVLLPSVFFVQGNRGPVPKLVCI